MESNSNNLIAIMQRMTFSMVGEYLGKKDHRTIKKWCVKHDVYFDQDDSGNYFVIQREFLFKANSKPEKALQDKYGDNWIEGLKATIDRNRDVPEVTTLLRKKKYKPQTPEAENFGEKWNHLLNG